MHLRVRPPVRDLGLVGDYLGTWHPRSQKSWVKNSLACFGYGLLIGVLFAFVLIRLFSNVEPAIAEAKTNLEQYRQRVYKQAVKDIERWNIERGEQERPDGSEQ